MASLKIGFLSPVLEVELCAFVGYVVDELLQFSRRYTDEKWDPCFLSILAKAVCSFKSNNIRGII